MKKFILCLISISAISAVLSFLILNIQLLIFKPQLFPVFESVSGTGLNGVVYFLIANLYLLVKYQFFPSRFWLISFVVMLIIYIPLSWLGIYLDSTQYLIAHAEGSTIGGGAAFGHLFLFFYIVGPAQIVSAVAFKFLKPKENIAKSPL